MNSDSTHQPPAPSKWNVTRIIVGHDSNYGAIPEPGKLINALEHFHAAAQAETVALLEQTLPYLEIIREFPNDDGSSSGSLADEIIAHLAQLKEGAP